MSKPKKNFLKMSAAELAAETRELAEGAIPAGRALTPEERERWDRARAGGSATIRVGPGRPKVGDGAVPVPVSVEGGLLRRATAKAAELGLKRSEYFARALQLLTDGADGPADAAACSPRLGPRVAADPFIVDNEKADAKVLHCIQGWCASARSLDVATGCFEIGGLLALQDQWPKLDGVRVLMGGDVSLRTKDTFAKALHRIVQTLDESIEQEKTRNDFLTGVDAIAAALKSGKIACRIYKKDEFHAKAYIGRRDPASGHLALAGSSNFTVPGLTENVELNVQHDGEQAAQLAAWFDKHWDAAEDVTPDILRVIERHVREHSPFEVYAKALHEIYADRDMTTSQWENNAGGRGSRVYPMLAHYQREAYHQLQNIAARYHGGFLCDGVGLGKTFVGLMLIEWLVEYERKRVALIVPKASRESVWEANIERYLPEIDGPHAGLWVLNHSDLSRGGKFEKTWSQVRKWVDVIVIDEAHHFRNPGTLGAVPIHVADPLKPGPGYIPGGGKVRPSRYRRLYEVAENKDLYMLTATPVNNRLIDLQHMIELFSRKQPDYFKDAPLGIHSLPGHFRRMEKELEQLIFQRSGGANGNGNGAAVTDAAEAEQVLSNDLLFRKLVVQRSRAFVKESQAKHKGSHVLFPIREAPKVGEYDLEKTYGKLLKMVEEAFSKTKPLFSLAAYFPLAYTVKGKEKSDDENAFERGRQMQIVRLIRTSFLKRFESSAEAFQRSCHALLLKLLAWAEVHSETKDERRHLDKFKTRHADLVGRVERQRGLFDDPDMTEDEDLVPQELLDAVEKLDRSDYDIPAMLQDTRDDLETVADFLQELDKFHPGHDDKLHRLLEMLKTDPVLSKHKVLIFSEYMDTARYLKEQLIAAGIKGVDEMDSATKTDRERMIRAFSPYYNGSSSAQLAREGVEEIRVLIATDILSEGLNLQDATRLINYDLHWNPVRLMQRIGRVDRRMNPDIEAKLLADHPDQKDLRGHVAYWNFLPPAALNELLSLWNRVTHKTLRISKTFGIEGKKLLRPEDDYEALKDFTDAYEGRTSPDEKLRLEYQKLLENNPGLEALLDGMPNRAFSGKAHPTAGARGVFFCFALPAPTTPVREVLAGQPVEWKEEAGESKWYLYDLVSGQIADEVVPMADVIRSTPQTPRVTVIEKETLSDIRSKVERHIKNTYLKAAQAPVGVKPVLKAWMELN